MSAAQTNDTHELTWSSIVIVYYYDSSWWSYS